MATSIKPIPVLEGHTADVFMKTAEETEKKYRASINFSGQVAIARRILKKARLQ